MAMSPKKKQTEKMLFNFDNYCQKNFSAIFYFKIFIMHNFRWNAFTQSLPMNFQINIKINTMKSGISDIAYYILATYYRFTLLKIT